MRSDVKLPRSTVLSFNTVERLLRGDFFHSVTPGEVRAELATFPADWSISGLGTTNWYRRHGELLIEGSAGHPRFLWADPAGDPLGKIVEFEDSSATPIDEVSPSLREERGCPHFPFAAVAVWDPAGPGHEWRLEEGQDVHAAIADWCESSNVGLAALCLKGALLDVEYQTMCHIPLGGIRDDAPASTRVEAQKDAQWDAVGFYSANPTIRAVLGYSGAAVHLHGRVDDHGRGGHWNSALATSTARVEVRPLQDLMLHIRDLDVALLPVRSLCA